MAEQQQVAVLGAGAIGCFYGMMLARQGHAVHFLMRSDYEVVREQGLHLHSVTWGHLHLDRVSVHRDAAHMPACDWVLVAAKTTANRTLAPHIAQVAAAGARVVFLQNGHGIETAMAARLPASLHLLGGLCMVSVHRRSPGVIEHHGYGPIHVGSHASDPQLGAVQRNALKALFEGSGIPIHDEPDLQQARWKKLVMNVPFNGLSVLLDTGTRALMETPATRTLVRDMMQEVMAAAAAAGHPLPDGFLDEAWQATDGQPDYLPSMYLDYRHGRPLELEAIYASPLAAAREAGAPMHKVEMLHQALCFLTGTEALASAG